MSLGKGEGNINIMTTSPGGHLAGRQIPVLRCRLTKISVERCESGRIDMLGKHASQQWDRGFESHPLRHKKQCSAMCVERSYSLLSTQNFEEGAGPCATEPCEPRQVRKEATVSGQFCVPQDHLAPLFLEARSVEFSVVSAELKGNLFLLNSKLRT
jgi:hypothetical protein